MSEQQLHESKVFRSRIIRPASHNQERLAPVYRQDPIVREQLFGNQALQAMLQSKLIQAKLTINPPDDDYEKEADQVADAVMRMPEPGSQGLKSEKEKDDEEKRLQTKPISIQTAPLMQPENQGDAEKKDDDEKKLLQTKSISDQDISLIQRDLDIKTEDEKRKKEDEEKRLQAKSSSDRNVPLIQREVAIKAEDERRKKEDEEKNLQTKFLPGQNPFSVQREVETSEEKERKKKDDEEKRVQTKSFSELTFVDHFGSKDQRDETNSASEQALESRLQRKCKKCPEKDKWLIQPKTLLNTAGILVEDSLVQNLGLGQPLDPSTLDFFEARFGHNFSQVRVHTGYGAGKSTQAINAKAFTVGHSIAFGNGQYAPKSQDGLRLLAHELTHVVQQSGGRIQRQGTSVQVQRNPGDSDAKTRVHDAITQASPSLINALNPSDIAQASSDERLTMIGILLERGGPIEQMKVPTLWHTFGKNLISIANQNPALWQQSFDVAAGPMRTEVNVDAHEKTFLYDVQDVASRYLDQNDKFCKDELQKLGMGEKGKATTEPPEDDQSSKLESLRTGAGQIAAAQEAMRDLRKIKVGYEVASLPPGGTGPSELGQPTMFDPDKEPNFPIPEGEPNRITWAEVKKRYSDLDELVQARLAENPTLYPLVRGAKEDPVKTSTVARGSQQQALSTIGEGLKETRENIAKTRPLLREIAPDLEPIHGQLLAGTVSIGGRNWKTMPFYRTLGRDIVEKQKPGPWWQKLGLMAAEMGAYVVAGLATGGTALAIGLAAKGLVEVATSQVRADVLESASQTNVTAETGLVKEGKVDEERAEGIMTAAFALIDIAVGLKELRGALRAVRGFEQEAAKAAAKATELADKAIAKETTKEEAAALAKEAKQAATEAKAAAEKASSAAGTASGEESARAAESSRQAAKAAESAERKASDIAVLASEVGEGAAEAAKHAPPVMIGDHGLKVRGNWITRCSPPPCMEFAASVAERAMQTSEELANSGFIQSRIAELRPRLNASAARASKLRAQAEAELSVLPSGDPSRLSIEKRLLDEAALVERDVQAVEREFWIEGFGLQQGDLPEKWGELVHENAIARINTIWVRATESGKTEISPVLNDNLKTWKGEVDNLLAEARRYEKLPKGKEKSNLKDKLTSSEQKIDGALEGIEREERSRADFRKEGGISRGESDKEIQKNLDISKGPDLARIKGDTLLLADSKGSDIPHVLEQFEAAMGSSKLPPNIIHYDIRIYLKANVWENLLKNGSIGQYIAKRKGDNWYLIGLPEVRGNSILLLPG